MSQKAKITAVMSSFITDKGLKFDGAVVFTKEQKTEIGDLLALMHRNGEIDIGSEKERKDPAKYFRSTVSNYCRKDERFNGGIDYEPKTKKGPRKSKELTALEGLLAAVSLGSDQAVIAQVQAELDARLAIDAAEKNKDKEINLTHLDPAMAEIALLLKK